MSYITLVFCVCLAQVAMTRKVPTPAQTCINNGFQGACEKPYLGKNLTSICQKLACAKLVGNGTNIKKYLRVAISDVPDGTICGPDMMCRMKRCSDVDVKNVNLKEVGSTNTYRCLTQSPPLGR